MSERLQNTLKEKTLNKGQALVERHIKMMTEKSLPESLGFTLVEDDMNGEYIEDLEEQKSQTKVEFLFLCKKYTALLETFINKETTTLPVVLPDATIVLFKTLKEELLNITVKYLDPHFEAVEKKMVLWLEDYRKEMEEKDKLAKAVREQLRKEREEAARLAAEAEAKQDEENNASLFGGLW